jgi:hypothetical protein
MDNAVGRLLDTLFEKEATILSEVLISDGKDKNA